MQRVNTIVIVAILFNLFFFSWVYLVININYALYLHVIFALINFGGFFYFKKNSPIKLDLFAIYLMILYMFCGFNFVLSTQVVSINILGENHIVSLILFDIFLFVLIYYISYRFAKIKKFDFDAFEKYISPNDKLVFYSPELIRICIHSNKVDKKKKISGIGFSVFLFAIIFSLNNSEFYQNHKIILALISGYLILAIQAYFSGAFYRLISFSKIVNEKFNKNMVVKFN